MNYEKALDIIKEVIYDNKGKPVNYIDLSFSMTEGDIGAEEFINAVEYIISNSVPKDKIREMIDNEAFEIYTRDYGGTNVIYTDTVSNLVKE